MPVLSTASAFPSSLPTNTSAITRSIREAPKPTEIFWRNDNETQPAADAAIAYRDDVQLNGWVWRSEVAEEEYTKDTHIQA
jgi:hypothetical protein